MRMKAQMVIVKLYETGQTFHHPQRNYSTTTSTLAYTTSRMEAQKVSSGQNKPAHISLYHARTQASSLHVRSALDDADDVVPL